MPHAAIQTCCYQSFCPVDLHPADRNEGNAQKAQCCADGCRPVTDALEVFRRNDRNFDRGCDKKQNKRPTEHLGHQRDDKGNERTARFPDMTCRFAIRQQDQKRQDDQNVQRNESCLPECFANPAHCNRRTVVRQQLDAVDDNKERDAGLADDLVKGLFAHGVNHSIDEGFL